MTMNFLTDQFQNQGLADGDQFQNQGWRVQFLPLRTCTFLKRNQSTTNPTDRNGIRRHTAVFQMYLYAYINIDRTKWSLQMKIFAALFSTSLSLAGNLGLHYLSKEHQVQEQRCLFLLLLLVCTVFLCAQTMVWLPMFEIFNMRTGVDACYCTRGLYRNRKSLHWKSTLGQESFATPGDSNKHLYCTWLLSLTL